MISKRILARVRRENIKEYNDWRLVRARQVAGETSADISAAIATRKSPMKSEGASNG